MSFVFPSDGTTNTALNRAYFCPRCGEIWARINFGSSDWRPVIRGCKDHKYYSSEHNGSLLENWREDINIFSREALIYEVKRALQILS